MKYQIDMDSIAAIYRTAISFYLDQRIEALLPSKALHVACGVVEIGVGHVSVTKRMFPLAETKLPFLDICWLFSRGRWQQEQCQLRPCPHEKPAAGHWLPFCRRNTPTTAVDSPHKPISAGVRLWPNQD